MERLPEINRKPVVFISYSHDSDEHKQWVHRLAARLCDHDVEVILDQSHLLPGDDVPTFMEDSFRNADYILCICTENYNYKANQGTGGVGYEKMIITQELIRKMTTNKFIPVIRNVESEVKTPICLGSKNYVDLSDNLERIKEQEKLLLRSIFRTTQTSERSEEDSEIDSTLKIPIDPSEPHSSQNDIFEVYNEAEATKPSGYQVVPRDLMENRRSLNLEGLNDGGLTRGVQEQISNAKKHIEGLIDYILNQCDGNMILFSERLPISTTITWNPPGRQAQGELRRHYIGLGFSHVEFHDAKEGVKVTLS